MKNRLAILVTVFFALLLAGCGTSFSKKQQAPMKLFPFSNDEKFGYADLEGKVVIEPQFDCAYMFRDGVALVRVGIGKDARYGYVKEDGTVLAEPVYVEATQFNEGLAWVVEKDGFPTAIDTKGKVQIEAKEVHGVGCFSDGLAAFCIEEKPYHYLWGYMNTSGKVVIEPQFKFADNFSDGLAVVETDKGWCYVDTKGKLVLQHIFNEKPEQFHNGRAVVEADDMNHLMALVDKNGKQVTSAEYQKILPDGDIFLFVKLDQLGWMDKDGKVLFTLENGMSVRGFGGAELAAFIKDGKWGYLDRKGQITIPAQYDGAFPFSGGHAVVMKDQHIGIINEKGEFVVNPTFSHNTIYHSALEDYGSVNDDYPSVADGVVTRYVDPELLENTRITGKGVGPIKIDMKLSDIPKSVKYLYDSVVVDRTDNEDEDMVGFLAYAMFYQNGRPVFDVGSWDGKTVGSIGVGFDQMPGGVNPIYFQADERRCHLKDSFKPYISEHKLKKTTVESCGGPISYYDLQGLKIYTNRSGAIEQFEIGEYLILWD